MNQRKLLPTVVLSFVAFAIQPNSDAQVNLVNLNSWSNGTLYASAYYNSYNGVISYDSAAFFGSYAELQYNHPFVVPILTGSIATTPLKTYELSYTLTHENGFASAGSMSFGGNTLAFDLMNNPALPMFSYISQNYDYVVTADSPSTVMAFSWTWLDNADYGLLSNFSVTEVQGVTPVPEVSTARLILLAGAGLLAGLALRRYAGGHR